MLKQSEAFVIHPVFGKIRIEEKFAKVLQLKYFRELGLKSQLGTKSLSSVSINAKHTRLTHSIGVMYLTEQLIEACEKKFSDYFSISQQDKEILKLAALGHDIGHLAFSHSLEDRSMKTHEERTIQHFENYAEEINDIFGYNIVSSVIQLYKDNIDIKKNGNRAGVDAEDELDILFIFKSLLVGTIDCDRMEYLSTDCLNVYGEVKKFTEIFNYITIVLLNDSPTVGFEREALPIIEDLLLTRFDQYSKLYYEMEATLLEMTLKRYKEIAHWDEEQIVAISEYQILAELKNILSDPEEIGTESYRIAQILLEGSRENIMFKRFENNQEYEYFLKRLQSIVSSKFIRTDRKLVTVYDPNKNKVYIKDDNGMIKDIMEVSSKIREYTVNYAYIMVDLDPIYGISENERKEIKSLFLDNPVEIEKKFTFQNNFTTHLEGCELVFKVLKEIDGVSIKKFSEWESVVNEDIYFDSDQVPKDVAIRNRKCGNKESYYIKMPADDGTTITKRYENKFDCQSKEEFVKLARELFISRGINIDELKLSEGVRITTERFKTLATIKGSIIEIACDFSKYEYAGNKANGTMLECELKKGDDISLWYIGKHLKDHGFVETHESKETRAKKALGIL